MDNKRMSVISIQHYKQFKYEWKLFTNILPTTIMRYEINDNKSPFDYYMSFFCALSTARVAERLFCINISLGK